MIRGGSEGGGVLGVLGVLRQNAMHEIRQNVLWCRNVGALGEGGGGFQTAKTAKAAREMGGGANRAWAW